MGGDEIDGNGRNTRRAQVRIGAQIRADGGPRFSVDVLDLSLSGFRIHSLNYIGPEARVVLTLPELSPLSAHIVWANADIYGCAFDAPLYPAVFDHIASKFPSFGDGDSA